MYKYEDSILVLINEFIELKKAYEDDKEYYEDLPYIFYEDVFIKYIINALNKENEPRIIAIFKFVEELLKYGDKETVNLIEVGVAESLLFENSIVDKNLMKKYFGELTLKSYNDCI